MEDLFPLTLQDIKEVADNCKSHSTKVCSEFAHVEEVIRQLQLAGINKELATNTNMETNEGLKLEVETRKKQAEEEKTRMRNDLDELKRKEKHAQEQVDKAFDELPSAGTLFGLGILDTICKVVTLGQGQSSGDSAPKEDQSVAEGDKTVELANDGLVEVMKNVKNMHWIGEFFNETEKTINKDSVSTGLGKGKSINFASDRLKQFGLDIDTAVEKGANKDMAQKVKEGVEAIEKAVDFAKKSVEAATRETDSKDDTVAELIAGMHEGQHQITSILDDLQCLINKGSAFEKQLPLEKHSGGGAAANAIRSAHIKLQQALVQWENQQRRVDEKYRQISEQNKEVHKQVVELQKLNARELTLGEILQTLKVGLNALAQMKVRWQQMTMFFDKMASHITTAMNPKLYALQDRCPELMRNRAGIATRRLAYRLAYEASTEAYVISEQAGAYHEISGKHLMPLITGVGSLIGLEEKQVKIKAEQLRQDSEKAIGAVEDLIKEKMEKHAQSRQARMKELQETFNNCIPVTDETAKAKGDAKMVIEFSQSMSHGAALYDDLS